MVPVVPASACLEELARLQLFQGPTRKRYQMHDLLRLYASKLAHDAEGLGGVVAARLRHMRHYRGTARRADELVVPKRYRLPEAGTAEIVTDFDGYDQALDWLNRECATMVELSRLEGPELDPLRRHLAFAPVSRPWCGFAGRCFGCRADGVPARYRQE